MVQLPEWKHMERELSAATQIIAEASSQALVLEKMYADAPSEERAMPVDLRWAAGHARLPMANPPSCRAFLGQGAPHRRQPYRQA